MKKVYATCFLLTINLIVFCQGFKVEVNSQSRIEYKGREINLHSLELLPEKKLESNLIPLLDTSSIGFNKKIVELLIYPKFAKRKFIEYTSYISVNFDEKFHLKEEVYPIQMTKEFCNPLLFDSNSVKIVKNISSFLAVNDKVNKNFIVPIEYHFRIDEQNNKLYFEISILGNYNFIVDSTNTFPPFFFDKRNNKLKQNFIIKENSLNLFGYLSGSKTRYNLKVDTSGEVNDYNVTHKTEIQNDVEADYYFSKRLLGSFIPAREDGLKIESYMDFDMILGNSLKEKADGDDYFLKKDYKKAFENYQLAKFYYFDDIELLYNLAMTEIQLEKYDDACKDLEEIKHVAIDKPFPACVSEAKVDELIKLVCPKTQE